MQAYDDLLASLDRAIAVLDHQPERLGIERDAYEKLKEIRERVAEAQRRAGKSE